MQKWLKRLKIFVLEFGDILKRRPTSGAQSIVEKINIKNTPRGEKIKTFAYPYGSYDSRIIDYLKRKKPCSYAFTTQSNSNNSNYEMSRINLNITPYYAFHVEISGIFSWIKGIYR